MVENEPLCKFVYLFCTYSGYGDQEQIYQKWSLHYANIKSWIDLLKNISLLPSMTGHRVCLLTDEVSYQASSAHFLLCCLMYT